VFGNSTNDAPINYSILQLNWTADPLQCVLLNQVITLQSRFSNVNRVRVSSSPGALGESAAESYHL
jgi:hypothetical protein